MVKKRVKAVAQVPQSRAEAELALARIGELMRQAALSKLAAEEAIQAANVTLSAETEPLTAELKALHDGIRIWCEANRSTLTHGGKVKSAMLATGRVGWRFPPASVAVKGADEVLKKLHDLGLTQFIRITEAVDKEAILKDAETVRDVPGITIRQDEEFFIEVVEAPAPEVVA